MPATVVLIGGQSSEYSASCRSYEHLRELLWLKPPEDLAYVNVMAVLPDGSTRVSGPCAPNALPTAREITRRGRRITAEEALTTLRDDAAFILSLLRGQNGEDGTWQGVSRWFDLPDNTGGPLTAARCADRYTQACIAADLAGSWLQPVAMTLVPTAAPRRQCDIAKARFGAAPVVLRPNGIGGAFKVQRMDRLDMDSVLGYAAELASYDEHFVIQEWTDGVELATGIIHRAGERVLLPVSALQPPRYVPGALDATQCWLAPGATVAQQLPRDDPWAARVHSAVDALSVCLPDETYYMLRFIAGADGQLRLCGVELRPDLSRCGVFAALLAYEGLDLVDLLRLEYGNHVASRAFRQQRMARIAEWIGVNG